MSNMRSNLFSKTQKSYGTNDNTENDAKAMSKLNDKIKQLDNELVTLEAIKIVVEAGNYKDAIFHSSVGHTRLKEHGVKINEIFSSLNKSAEEFKYNQTSLPGIIMMINNVKTSFVNHLNDAINDVTEAKNAAVISKQALIATKTNATVKKVS